MNTEVINKFNELLNLFNPIPAEIAEEVFKSGRVEPYAKDEIVFHEKRFSEFEYFQLEGLSHRYIFDSTSNKLTTGIYEGQIVITPHFGRTNEAQNIFSLQTLSDSSYFIIPVKEFEALRSKYKQVEHFAQAVVATEYKRMMNLEILFRVGSAKERLVHFRKNYSQLENKIPHLVIATFLGITSVSLSRIRSELSKA